MPKRVRVVPHLPGFNAVRNDPTLQALLQSLGDDMKARADANLAASKYAAIPASSDGVDHTANLRAGGTRSRVTVSTHSLRARIAEHSERTLFRALQGGGGGGSGHQQEDDGKVNYTRRDGVTIRVTRLQANNYGNR